LENALDFMKKFILALGFILTGCVSVPEGIKPVDHFEVERYLGTWYEIARLDHSFERGLSRVSATYQLREDGGISVLNRGYSAADGAWQSVEGKAYFVEKPDQGYLKVSFFGPFYGAYVIFALDQANYQYSLVSGPDRSYFWLLARNPTIDEKLKDTLVAKAQALGFATDRLIFVNQSPADPLTQKP
jgi:apolipoprotein D and lipocalin family protein